MNEFTQLIDLATERLGGAVLAANDEFFAPKENLLKTDKPVFIEEKYTDRGKWMDGWETRRRRTPGHDWCIVRLGLPGIVRRVVVDTSFFRGNFPSHCSIEACAVDGSPSASQLAGSETPWREILPKSQLTGDTQNSFTIAERHRFTHLRLNIFPDGGVARLRVYGEVLPDWKHAIAAGDSVDLAAIAHGGHPLLCSDMFFSAPQNLLMPYPAENMGDGWETKRRRGPGHDWVVLKLGIAGEIERIEVDTAHFKGNYPESCSLEACHAAETNSVPPESWAWQEVLPRTALGPDQIHVFHKDLRAIPLASHVRFNIFPDGGISRLRIIGKPASDALAAEGVRWLNALDASSLHAALLNCCGSSAWVKRMLEAAPFANVSQFLHAAENAFAHLEKEDWLEAFKRHPRIGEKKSDMATSSQASGWASQEQSGMSGAPAEIAAELAVANSTYEKRFGYIFIVCASGKTAGETLALLRQRLNNAPESEIRAAAEEQQKITRLRLERLLKP